MASKGDDHNRDPDHETLTMQADKRTHECKLSAAAFGPKTGKSQLEVDFQPSDHSVICGRDREHNHHTGNCRFRALASTYMETYSQADGKTTKSAIVFHIVTMIRQAGGHFCRYQKGAWFEVGDRAAREKVSAYFRDILHTQYRSSSKSKTILRRARQRNKRQNEKYGQQLVDSTVHLSDRSMSLPCLGSSSSGSSSSSSSSSSSTDSLGFDSSQEIDFFDIDVF
jgi:hypothetical protein